MGKTFNNWKDLEKHLQLVINDTLNSEVAKEVKDQIHIAVDKEVYQSYTPKQYQRRGASGDNRYLGDATGTGSLGDREQMKAKVKDGTLIVTNEAGFNPMEDRGYGDVDRSKSLAYNIEYGYGNKNKEYNKPRRFMQSAVEEMRKGKHHIEAMKEGLEKRLGKDVVE